MIQLKLRCIQLDNRVHVEIAPRDLYPPMLAYIRKLRQSSKVIDPPELGGKLVYVELARRLPDFAFDYALIPRDAFYPHIPYHVPLDTWRAMGVAPESLVAAERVQFRGAALELALDWFRRVLLVQYSRPDGTGGYNLHILRDRDFRL